MIVIDKYSLDKTFIIATAWSYESTTITEDCYIKILIEKTNVQESDIPILIEKLVVTRNSSSVIRNSLIAVTDELALKIDKTAIKQALGTSPTDVMSQKAVTDEIAQLADDVNELSGSVETEVSRLNNLNTVGYPINYFIGNGLSSTSPKYLFYNRDELATNPKLENIVDVDSPFKDILGYVAKISNTYETNPNVSFLTSTSSYIGVIPERMDVSFWTKDSDFDSILEGFTPSWGFYSYSPTVLDAEIDIDIKKY